MQQAVLFLRAGMLKDAETCYREILAIYPKHFEAHQNLGISLMLQNRMEEAKTALWSSIAINPGYSRSHYHLGEVLERQGQFEEAENSYRRALDVDSGFAEAWHNIGSIKLRVGAWQDAALAFRRALSLKPSLNEARNNLGTTLSMLGSHEQAIEIFRELVTCEPDNPQGHNNLGIALSAKGEFAQAIQAYLRAIAIFPSYDGAYINLGLAHKAQGNLNEAETSYRKAIAINSANPHAQYQLGMVLCELDRLEEACACYERHAELTQARQASGQAKGSHHTHKLQHDAEQGRYLESLFAADCEPIPSGFHRGDGSRIAGPAIRLDSPAADVERRWRESRPKIVVIDNFLTEPALAKLRDFCWRSTIWQKVYEEGYLGAMPEHGFACPLIAQIANELRASYPQIFQSLPLLQFWAFKYDSRLSGISLHADFAALNVNFWITPDDANLDPNTGGLVIWDVEAPREWSFVKYNKSAGEIAQFLAQKNAKALRIPYRANRAVIFDSDLFHQTDKILFKDGYINRRMNITFLFGRREVSTRGSVVPANHVPRQ